MAAQEADQGGAGAVACAMTAAVDTGLCQGLVQRAAHRLPPGRRGIVAKLGQQVAQPVDDHRELELGIGRIGETGCARGLALHAGAPEREAARCRPDEEERPADRGLDKLLDVRPQCADDLAHAADAAAALGYGLEIVADRLLARQVAERAEDRAEEAGQLDMAARVARPGRGQPERPQARGRLDIDEAPVDHAPRRTVLERANGLGERRIGQYRSVDEHGVLGRAVGGVSRQDPLEKCDPAWPVAPAPGQHGVQLARREGREGAGESSPSRARRRPVRAERPARADGSRVPRRRSTGGVPSR